MTTDVTESIAETIRTSIGRNKVKYKLLNEDLTINRIDQIHINLDSIFQYVTSKYLSDLKSEMDDSFKYTITGSIFNLVGHYRHYAIKNGFVPKVYIYVALDKWGYAIDEAIKVLEIITAYIDGVYTIKIPREDQACPYMKYFIDKYPNSKSLIISKSYVDLQLVNPDTDILHTNKDNSVLYSSDNVLSVLADTDKYPDVSYELIGPYLFLSGIGLNNSGIKGYGKKKALKLLDNLIKDGYLYNGKYNAYEDFKRDLSRGVDIEEFGYLSFNFSRYSLDKLYLSCVTTSRKKILDAFIIDKFSKKDLAELNSRYFTGADSITLEFLLELPANPKDGGNKLRW